MHSRSLSETVVFDLETQKSLNEVGGRRNIRRLRMSVAVLYRFRDHRYIVYRERQAKSLLRELSAANCIVGFAINHFDYPVLERYGKTGAFYLKTIDIQETIASQIGRRPSLESLALGTIRTRKGQDGLAAIRLFKARKMRQLIDYCKDDVDITRRIYEFSLKHGEVYLLEGRRRKRVKVPW